ncbi:acyl-CoA dehydrogenase family protein [Nocardioides sp. B-3]|uniref:acyl-CoA dehydrogenase family protein n=1 Tax=Nocardioides sp. B-3 TaxID=2895565 RepID=UPI00215213AB|nr:acyl-CoA dehydrogenase family protein [Nocardioides sp. B-3]UUZ58064.1 acyl-CoA dehydrogenase family protein [Nocardioides sp. B-3]
MTFELSPEHEQFRRSVRDFAQAEIAPHAAQWDRDHHFPTDVVQKMGALGLMGLTAPEEYGGSGLAGEDGGFTSLCIAIEEIGRVDQSMGITLEAAVGLGINPILTYGTAAQKEEHLPSLVAGEQLAGFGLTEPGAGSDAGATRTKADPVEGEWVVNGAKQFITNSGSSITSLVTVTAKTGEREGGRPEISTIIIPSGTPGFTAEKAYDKLGWHASDTHPLSFEDARVRGQPARRPRSRLRPVPRHPRRRPRRDRRPRRRLHPSLPGPVARNTPWTARPSAAPSAASRASPSVSPTSG